VNGFCFHAGRFGQPLGRPPGGGAEQAPDFLGAEDKQDGVDQGRLAHARSAGDDERPARERLFHRLPLAGRKFLAGLLLAPCQMIAQRSAVE